ncbi:MAG: hypothetical protein K2X46_09625 [Roseomonas sp.]|nr:hypothetical protein [Roseomonas sp.]
MNLLNAFRFAWTKSMPLNTYVVVSFPGSAAYGGSGRADADRTRASRDAAIAVLRQLAHDEGFPVAYVYALENPPQGGHGLHINFLTHLPEDRHEVLRASLHDRLEDEFPQRERHGTFVPVKVATGMKGYREASGILLYSLKGLDPACMSFARVRGERVSDEGTIFGKRAGCSRTIDRGSRRQARYVDDLSALHLAHFQLQAHRRAAATDLLRQHLGRIHQREAAASQPPAADGTGADLKEGQD